MEELRQAYGAAAFDALELGAAVQLYRGVGVRVQPEWVSGAGGLHEQLVATPEIKRLIQQRARITEVAACAQQEGMTTLLQDGVLKVLAGVTDIHQVKASPVSSAYTRQRHGDTEMGRRGWGDTGTTGGCVMFASPRRADSCSRRVVSPSRRVFSTGGYGAC